MRRISRVLRRIVSGLLVVLALVAVLVGGVLFWYHHRPLPERVEQTLFEGVTYVRDVRSDPRSLVIHVVTVDLDAPGISFLVTPGEPTAGHHLRAQTTSAFLAAFDLQLAINAAFFEPWWSHTPWDYYPHAGDPVNVHGLAASEGDVYAPDAQGRPTLYLSRDNRASFDAPSGEVYNAVSGDVLILVEGEIPAESLAHPYHNDLHPRTAVALDAARETLLLVVVDGRQPNYSEGVTSFEMAAILRDYGGDTALNLDGGGSSTLVVAGEGGEPVILNSPIDHHIPGRERPVANHLGVRAGVRR